jgi:MFS family permease
MEKPLWMICTTHMFLEVYLLIQVALIPVIIQEFQLSPLEASLVVTIPSLVQLLMNIPSGFLADRFNTQHLLFASMLVEGVSAIIVSQTSNFWTLVVAVSFVKISSPLYHISGLSQISRLAKPKQINRSMGFHNAFGSLGSAIGVVSLAVFMLTLGWRWTYLFWAVPILIWGCIILMSSQLKTKQFEKTETKSKLGSRRLSFILSSGLLFFLIAIAVREVGGTGSSTFMTTYFVETRNLSESTASLIFGLGPFMGIVGSLSGGYLGERIGAKKALNYAIIGCAISLFILSLASQLYFLALIYILYSFFNNAVWSPINSLVADMTPITERGLSFSVYFFTEGLIGSIAPTLAAGVIELSDVWFVFPFSIVFFVACLVILQFLPNHKQK